MSSVPEGRTNAFPSLTLATAASITLIITGVISTPMPSPSIKGMIGLLGTLIEKSEFTVIFSPDSGSIYGGRSLNFEETYIK